MKTLTEIIRKRNRELKDVNEIRKKTTLSIITLR